MELLYVKKIKLQRYCDNHGKLSVIEEYKGIPFEINRVYWIYDVPCGESRGGHAYYENNELVIAISGCFDLILSDGVSEMRYTLNRPDEGIFIPAGFWRELINFSTNAQALIFASTKYNPNDYIINKNELVK